EINNYKSFWCAEKIKTAKLEFELKNGRKPKIALMGLAFKPDIDDLRESPAIYIVNKVLENDKIGEYFVVEPNVESHKSFDLTDYKTAVEKADIIALLVSHKEFKDIDFGEDKIVLDFCGVCHNQNEVNKR
ncbi:MAG: UDP-N-acetyl-D-mannosamine dehydrogenase, partial [Oceanivirga sp.]|nr:UDP-N-acetyl-D-mannosamine dehydrogenase [Oceanivirga sp.]